MDATDAWWSNVVHKDYAGESSKNFVQNFDFFIQVSWSIYLIVAYRFNSKQIFKKLKKKFKMTNLIATDMGCGMALCPVGDYHEKIQLVVCQYYPLYVSILRIYNYKYISQTRYDNIPSIFITPILMQRTFRDSSLAEKIRKFLTENRVRFLELAREYS